MHHRVVPFGRMESTILLLFRDHLRGPRRTRGIMAKRKVRPWAIVLALAALAVIAATRCVHVAAQDPAPDLLLLNGKIFTSDAAHAYVQALAIRGERIVATG